MKLRPFLVAATVFLTGFMCFTIWYKIVNVGEPPVSKIDEKIHVQTEPIETQPKPVVPELVLKLNQKNSQIHSLRCENMDVKVWQDGMRVHLSGEVYYEKPLKFRMFISSIFGKELDLGANEEVFWYWSRRNKREGLFYARYEDFFNTRLKTPFGPVFLRASFGVDELPTENAKFVEDEKGVLVVVQSKNSMGKSVNKYTFINKQTELIEGYLISYEDGKKSASAEIMEHENGLPKKILFTYYEEDQIMQLELSNIQMNASIDGKMWQIPSIQPQINMGEQAGAAVQYDE